MPAPSTSTIISSWAIGETCRPWCAASATSGPEISTDMKAGISVVSASVSDRKMSTSSTMMKMEDRYSIRPP